MGEGAASGATSVSGVVADKKVLGIIQEWVPPQAPGVRGPRFRHHVSFSVFCGPNTDRTRSATSSDNRLPSNVRDHVVSSRSDLIAPGFHVFPEQMLCAAPNTSVSLLPGIIDDRGTQHSALPVFPPYLHLYCTNNPPESAHYVSSAERSFCWTTNSFEPLNTNCCFRKTQFYRFIVLSNLLFLNVFNEVFLKFT